MTAARAAAVAASLLVVVATAAPAFAKGGTPAEEGRRVFLRLNCYGCHGANGGGGMGPNLRGGETDELVERLKEGGGEGMPSFKNLVTDTDVDNLKAYIKSLNTPSEPTFVEWWKKNPSR